MNFDQERLLRQVILYFTHAVADRGSSLPKIKLVKLLYLVDLAGWHERGTPVTGLDWVFFHYGPYAPSLEPLFDRYEGQYFERRQLSRQATQRLVGEASQLGRATVPTENEVVFLFIPLANLPDEPVEDSFVAGLAERVAQRWAGSATEDLLRFVYATQPIAKGRRYESIDWNLQPRDSGIFGNRARTFVLPPDVRQRLESTWRDWETTGRDRGGPYEPEAWLFDDEWRAFNQRTEVGEVRAVPRVRIVGPRARRQHLDD